MIEYGKIWTMNYTTADEVHDEREVYFSLEQHTETELTYLSIRDSWHKPIEMTDAKQVREFAQILVEFAELMENQLNKN